MSPTPTQDAGFMDGVEYDEDGGIVFSLPEQQETLERNHHENLADFLDESELDAISGELIPLIEEDEQSRAEWLEHRAKGVELLGLKVQEQMKSGNGAASVDGLSAVRHPILLDACVHYQSTATAELLPAKGPVRVVNSSGDTAKDAIAVKLQRSLNAYLRSIPEYYPDTERAIFQSGWSGAAFKKGYHCPLRRRPTVESVDAKDLIISDRATCLEDAPRVTHLVDMDSAKFTRMKIAGAYRKIDLSMPVEKDDIVDEKIADTQGVRPSSNPKSLSRPIYECYCDWDIPGYEHLLDGEPSGLPLPYKISIDVTSRKVLEIRRDWNEDDDTMMRRRTFVMYPFLPMFGLYPYGMLHLLGNTTSALTTAWRMLLDSGLFANFPGFAFLKNGSSRQQDPDFRVGPGQGVGIDGDPNGDINKMITGLPYKDVGTSTIGLVGNIEGAGRRLAGTTEIKVGEGREIPVGTMAMAVEQAVTVLSAVHRRMHTAQRQEFELLKELLREDPGALWRHKSKDKQPSYSEKMLQQQMLEDSELEPAADPNMPSYLYRIIRALTIKQFSDAHPDRYNGYAVDSYCLQQMGVDDPERFFNPPSDEQQINPVAVMAEVEHEKNVVKMKTEREKEVTKRRDSALRHQDKEADRNSRESIEAMKLMERLAKDDQHS
ncbi:MAG: hypothetical protein P8Y47_04865 [Alphaproteobacteria bacterium]